MSSTTGGSLVVKPPLWRWAPPAIVLALVVNLGLFWLVSRLAAEFSSPQDISDPVAVRMVQVPPEEEPVVVETEEEEPPPPVPEVDFTPEIQRPDLGLAPTLGPSLSIDVSTLRLDGIGGDFVFGADDLDTPPQPISALAPVYPYRARQRGIEGWVRLKFLVSDKGEVSRLEVLEAQPEGVFENTALRTVPGWKYQPGRIGGKPVTAWVIKTIRFDLED